MLSPKISTRKMWSETFKKGVRKRCLKYLTI